MIKVGIADYKIIDSGEYLITYGLGSCVAVGLYDKKIRLAGLAHIMLPTQKLTKSKTNLSKYADTGIRIMLKEMLNKGADKSRLIAKIAGGAKMFSFSNTGEINVKIGESNIEAVKKVLEEEKIPISADDTGQNYGRTVEFYAESGEMKIKSLRHGIKII